MLLPPSVSLPLWFTLLSSFFTCCLTLTPFLVVGTKQLKKWRRNLFCPRVLRQRAAETMRKFGNLRRGKPGSSKSGPRNQHLQCHVGAQQKCRIPAKCRSGCHFVQTPQELLAHVRSATFTSDKSGGCKYPEAAVASSGHTESITGVRNQALPLTLPDSGSWGHCELWASVFLPAK